MRIDKADSINTIVFQTMNILTLITLDQKAN